MNVEQTAGAGAIPRRDALPPAVFRREHLLPQRPVILTGVVNRWRAASAWTHRYFRERFPDLRIRYERWEEAPGSRDDAVDYDRRRVFCEARLAEFVDLIAGASGRTLYSTNFKIFDVAPSLRADIEPLEPYMGVPRLRLEPYLWTGPAGTVSSLHFDRAHNLVAQIQGRKRWLVFPPDTTPSLYWPSPELDLRMLQFSPVDAERPDLDRFPLFARARPIEIVLEPGELLFLPAGWWHQVRSLDPAISLNVFWARPLQLAIAMRRYLFHYVRRWGWEVGRARSR